MKDKGLDRGLVQDFDTSARRGKGHFFGFRKMFWDYLTKLGVAFYDPCCEDAADAGTYPVRFNSNPAYQRLEYWNGTAWVDITQIDETTTTTTTSTTTTSSTTTTTTGA